MSLSALFTPVCTALGSALTSIGLKPLMSMINAPESSSCQSSTAPLADFSSAAVAWCCFASTCLPAALLHLMADPPEEGAAVMLNRQRDWQRTFRRTPDPTATQR